MKKISLLIFAALLFANFSIGQSATANFTQVPCNNDGVFTVSTSGFALPITYTYYVNGLQIVHSNVNSTTDQLTNIAVSNYGFVNCQVTSSSGSAWANDSYIPPFAFNTSANSPTCPATLGTVSASQTAGSSGPFDFVWMNNQTLNTYTGNNATVPLGFYSVTITDQTSGCVLQIDDTAAWVQQLSNVTASINTTDANCTNGSATAVPSGGVAPYSIQWITGATTSTINGLSQGNYGVTVTDAQGCQSNNLSAFVQQTPQISVNTTVTNATCVQSDGSIMAFGSGGASPYTYMWSNGQSGNTASNLPGLTSYNVVATDANGCIGSTWTYVNASTPITTTFTSTPSSCISPTGSATITANGGTPPYSYVWNVSPSVSGPTISNFPPGTYGFQVTDAVGCIRTGSAVISPSSTLNATASGSVVTCPATTGSAFVTVNGSNPPFTYLWSNGSTSNQITGEPIGPYSCVITDAAGCSVTKYTQISEVSPVNVIVTPNPVTCEYNTDGGATSYVSGGVGPYTYLYTDGSTTANTTGLGQGNYGLTVTDANGCSSYHHFVVPNAATSSDCYCTIEGTVYVDGNTDCVMDAGEIGVQNVMIHCSGQGYTFTDANGYYSFTVPTGTYTIEEQINAYYPLAPCQSMNTTVSVVAGTGCTSTVDISNIINPLSDLKITTMNSTVPPIPGNPYQQMVVVKNIGTVTESGVQLGYEHDGQLMFGSTSQPALTQLNAGAAPNHYSIQSGFPSLAPGAGTTILMNYNTPTNIPLGTVVTFFDSVANAAPIATNWLVDYSPWNNVNTHQPVVIGSYDPNYKEVSPRGVDAPGYIPSTSTEFDYTIHFQNEGTYFAQNIYITDQLDPDFDWTTLRPGYSDYSYTTTVSETGLVTFTFTDINLPWKSQYGDALSSGLINYSIERLSTNPQGTEFTNTADIFFDYNPPITTNTTLNTLNDDVFSNVEDYANSVIEESGISVDLYPVPANESVTIRINNVSFDQIAELSIFDLTGKSISSEQINLTEGSSLVYKNISYLENGTYLTRIQFEDGSFVVKKIVFSK